MQADSTVISRLLKKVCLGGTVEEAIVDLGQNTVQAVDPTNAVFLKVSESPLENGVGRIGIGNLQMVIKHLEMIKGEVSIRKTNNRLIIGAKGRGEVKYLTVAEEFVASAVAEDNIESLVDPCLVSVEIPAQSCADFSSYMALLKTKAAKFSYDPKTKMVKVESGLVSENQFTVPFGKAESISGDPVKEEISVTVIADHVDKIFGVLEWSKEKPMLLMAPEHPLLIVQDDGNIWACLPLNESEAAAEGEES